MTTIDTLSHDELKEFYFSFIGKNSLIKDNFNDNIKKIKDFNKLYLYEMNNLKVEFIELKYFFDKYEEKNTDIDTFKKYFNTITNQSFMDNYIHIRKDYEKVKEFNNTFSDNLFYNYTIRKKLLNKIEGFNSLYFEIEKFDNLIQQKIYNELKDLKIFFRIIKDLSEYKNLRDTPDSNIVKITNEKYINEQFQEVNDIENMDKNSDELIISENHMSSLNFDEFIKLLTCNIENGDEFNISFNLSDELINKIISSIDIKHCEFSTQNLNLNEINFLISNLDSYTSNITFIFSTKSFNNDEISIIVDKIKSDISNGIINGNIQSIVSFYLNQYKMLKEKILSLAFLNKYVESNIFIDFIKDYDKSTVESIINKVKSDIIYNNLNRDDILTKIKIYFEQNELKKD